MLQSRFRRQGIQSHVPRVGELQVGALAVKGESDQVRTLPVAPPPAKLQSSIVVSAPHPQAPALGIDPDQGYDDEIQPLRRLWGAPCGAAPQSRIRRAGSLRP